MTYPEALQYLNSFIDYERQSRYNYNKAFELGRMRRLARLLGNPHEEIRSIHVAGTKGKGSTSAIIQSILTQAGFKTGLYTSPHLVSFRERIRIGGSLITEEDVGRILEKVRSATEELDDEGLSFFEVYTALAYLYFKEKRCDFAVYETGLGGRLDATNIIEPLVSVITPISYEHTDKLGTTLRQIASEKGGIIKEGGICVLAPQEKEALGALEKICEAKKARIILVGRDVRARELSSDEEKEAFSVSGMSAEYPRLEMRLLGSHQVLNASTAIAAVETLRGHGIEISAGDIRKGIAAAVWPGRLEIVSREPFVALDGAQNRASADALASAVKKIFRGRGKYKNLILVLGVSKDKDIKGILDELLPIADRVILTKSKIVERAAEPSAIRELMGGRAGEAILTANVKEAMEKAFSKAGKEDLILITGSLFVVGEVIELLQEIASLRSQ